MFKLQKKFFSTSKQTRERLAKTKKIKRYALIGAAGSLGAVLIGIFNFNNNLI